MLQWYLVTHASQSFCKFVLSNKPSDTQGSMLFSNPIDSLAAAGAVLADVWLEDVQMPVVDCLGEEFLDYVKDGMTVTVKEDGLVVVE